MLGAYFGKGRATSAFAKAHGRGQATAFLLGVRDEAVPGRWLTVAKVGNGWDDAQLEAFNVNGGLVCVRIFFEFEFVSI